MLLRVLSKYLDEHWLIFLSVIKMILSQKWRNLKKRKTESSPLTGVVKSKSGGTECRILRWITCPYIYDSAQATRGASEGEKYVQKRCVVPCTDEAESINSTLRTVARWQRATFTILARYLWSSIYSVGTKTTFLIFE